MYDPEDAHWVAVKCMLCYLNGTLQGIHIQKSVNNLLQAYINSDWAYDVDDRKSILGYAMYFGAHHIPWKFRKKRTVSRSSIEAKYRAVAAASTELDWLQPLFCEIGLPKPPPLVTWSDNISTTYLTTNSIFHSRSKHLDVDIRYPQRIG